MRAYAYLTKSTLAWRGAGQIARNTKRLFVGPWIGEFGFEVMNLGVVRRLKQYFEEVIVCSRPGSRALYDGVADEFIAHDIDCIGACVGLSTISRPVSQQEIERWLPSPHEATMQKLIDYGNHWPGVYQRLGKRVKDWDGIVVVHARHREHAPERNWSRERWNMLARLLLRSGAVKRLVAIGTEESAWSVEGAIDARRLDLREQMSILASARLAIGPSSGPMHLAQHCGCPVMVWCGGPERFVIADRYRWWWNPLGTPAYPHVEEGWWPSVEQAYHWTIEALEKEAG